MSCCVPRVVCALLLIVLVAFCCGLDVNSSPECQKLHWVAGHKQECRRAKKQAKKKVAERAT